eukprot:758080-Hanusia_phi.AAC.11
MREVRGLHCKTPKRKCFALNPEQKRYVKMMLSKTKVHTDESETKQKGDDDFVLQNIERARSKKANSLQASALKYTDKEQSDISAPEKKKIDLQIVGAGPPTQP